MKKLATLLAIVVSCWISADAFAQTRGQQPADPRKEKLLRLAEEYHRQHLVRRAEVERVAREKGWVVRQETDEGILEIQYIDEYGMPQSYITTNRNAARTTNTDDLWPGESSGLDLNGAGFVIGEWDGGGILTTHQEFDNGSGTRVTQKDTPAEVSWHSTHVAGTLIAEGQSATAHGMAPEALLNAYDWNDDIAEMATEAANGLTVSNHSYGYNRGWTSISGTMYWYGNPSISTTEDYLFGFYDSNSQAWDEIAFNAPGYLIVKAAGNDRDDSFSGTHAVYNGTSWVWSNAARDDDGGTDGYDCIDQNGVAKNVLTIGAVGDITGGWTSPSDVVMSGFSSWGPTDDGRIKPDLVANGVGLFSCNSTGTAAYTSSDGTSMASPNATGTLALLQDYYQSLRGATMSAAALKGLVINTANEAGPADGPDYMFGWGLLNATGAADLITLDDTEGGHIVESILVNAKTTDYTYYSDGSEINVTLCWTDPAGTPPSASLNPTTLMLKNDLDLRVIGASTYYPWILNPSSPSANATKGDNTRDNVETVNIKNPVPGYYTIRVNHGGSLTGGSQPYALIIRGMTTPPALTYCPASATYDFEYIQKVTFGTIDNTTGRSPGNYADYTGLVNQLSKGASATLIVTLGSPWSGDIGFAWVDWDQDGVFEESEKTILGSGNGPYIATITVPATAFAGYTTMRIRIVDSFGGPCNDPIAYGETEDYTIRVTGSPGIWRGLISSDWNVPNNWDDGNIPTAAVNVTIPAGTPYAPVITNGSSAYAASIYLNPGASLSQNSSSWFYVNGTFDAGFGQFTMNGSTSYLYLRGGSNSDWWDDNQNDTYTTVVLWKSNTTAQVTLRHNVTCSGLIEIFQGVLALDNCELKGTSTSELAFAVRNGAKIILDNSLDGITTAGSVQFDNGSQATLLNGTIKCAKDFIVQANVNDIQFAGSTLEMNGSSTQYINDLDAGALDLYNLTINKPGGVCYLKSANLDVNGSVVINSGALSCDNGPSPASTYTIRVAGNWINYVGDAGFLESTGRVIFDGGNYHQYCTNETFHILEVNKAAGGAFRPYYENHVVCAAYDWTAGAVDVLTGSFTANDLLDNAIKGKFYNNTGGTINLTANLVDLAGELHNYGGTYNITGNVSWWPYQANALVEMTAGVIDLTSCGLFIYNTPSYSLTDNITGGTIRTSVGFSGNRADFTPAAGIFEFYGSADAFISQANGCTLPNVVINKTDAKGTASAPEKGSLKPDAPRKDLTKGDGLKANGLSLSSDITITNDLTIQSGVLNTAGNAITIGGDWYNNAGFTGFSASGGTVTFQSLTDPQDVWGNTEFNNVVQLYSAPLNYLRLQDANTILGDLELHHFCWTYDQLDVNGTLNINDPASKFTANGSLASATIGALDQGGKIACNAGATLTVNDLLENGLEGTISLNGGTFNVYQDALQFIDLNANLTILEGTMNVYGTGGGASYWPYSGNASITMSGGVLDFKELGVIVYDSPGLSLAENITGGTIRTTGMFDVQRTDYTPSGGITALYGGSDVWVSTVSGSSLHDLLINKSGGTKGMSGPDDAGSIGPGALMQADIKDDLSLVGSPGNGRIKMPAQGSKSNQVQSGVLVQVNGTTTVDAGTLVVDGGLATCLGNIDINSGGILSVVNSGTLAVGNLKSLTVNDGGLLKMDGDPGSPVTLTHNTGYYGLNIENGGSVFGDNCIFEYMNTSGVNIKAGALALGSNPFSNCTFQNGQGGGTLVTVDNSQTFSVPDAVFPANTWGGVYNVSKNVNGGMVSFVNATGAFAGESYDNDAFSRVTWNRTFDLKIFLEGPFDPVSNTMKTDLNAMLPVSQPFSPVLPYFGNPAPDWYYGGTENAGVIPNPNIVDWVVVQLRDAASAASATPATAIATQAAFVNSQGAIVGLDGLSPLALEASYANNLFVVVWHRNHLGVISASALVDAGGLFSYDFTDGSGKALGTTGAQKQLAAGIWGLMAGDGDGSGGVTAQDRDNVWDIQAGTDGYKAADYNFSGQVNNPDKNDCWVPNLGKGSYIPE